MADRDPRRGPLSPRRDGRPVKPFVSLGTWSRDWLKREITAEEADPALLMWDVRRSLRLDRLPQEQLVVFFRFRDADEGKRAWWLVAEETGADLCFSDPGFPIVLQIDAEAQAMAEVWVGRLELGTAVRSGRVKLRGPEHLVRSVPDWHAERLSRSDRAVCP